MECVKCNKSINVDANVIKYQDGIICRECVNDLIVNKSTEIIWQIVLSNIESMLLKAMLKQLADCTSISNNNIELIFKNKAMAQNLANSLDKKQCLSNAINKIYNSNNTVEIIIKYYNYAADTNNNVVNENRNYVKNIAISEDTKNKDWVSEFFDFLGFHFLSYCVGIPILSGGIIVGLIYFFCWIFNIKITNDALSVIMVIVALFVTNAVSFVYSQMKISEVRKISEKNIKENIASTLNEYIIQKNEIEQCKQNITKQLTDSTLKLKLKEQEIKNISINANIEKHREISAVKNTYDNVIKEWKDTLSLKNKELNAIKAYCNEINNKNSLIKENLQESYNRISEFISDINTYDYEMYVKYLETKRRPAYKKAQDIRELKQKTKVYLKEYKLMRYEYDMLFSLFPELENYIEYYSTEKDNTIEDVKENYDYVRSWIDKDEYEQLDENTRNQLALDRYIESRKKSKWAIGRDYEMFIGHEYEQKGYKVTYTGITERLEDKGRDLIAQKDNKTLIIQCKNWAKYKEIHENHICQLFGTTIQYNIENNTLFKAIPVFITSATLSDTALKFAEHLGVRVIQNKKFEEFPRIKCNINSNEKIYHLPFDQQYDRTVIGDQKGEFFAWTVEEAVNKGFRRAKKYFYVK